jgi:GAG-pre-integrase domain
MTDHVALATSQTPMSAMLWHRRLGHLPYKDLCVLRQTPGTGVLFTGGMEECVTCPQGKAIQLSHPKEATTRATTVLGRVHMDV